MKEILDNEAVQANTLSSDHKGPYTLETLTIASSTFSANHSINQDDVDIVNKAVKLIRESRRDTPQPGDVVRYTDKYGTFYPTARIDEIRDNMPNLLCMVGNQWVFYRKDDNESLKFQVGCGGPFVNDFPVDRFELMGRRKVPFVIHGHLGSCAFGALDFEAEVNEWRYVEPDALHGEYTTENWDRRYFYRREDNPQAPPNVFEAYQYISDGLGIKTDADFKAWADTYRGKVFEGHSERQKVVFHYRECAHLIAREEWEALDLPMDTRACNGLVMVKVRYDDNNHIVHEYRYSNAGNLSRLGFSEYEMARGTAQARIMEMIEGRR